MKTKRTALWSTKTKQQHHNQAFQKVIVKKLMRTIVHNYLALTENETVTVDTSIGKEVNATLASKDAKIISRSDITNGKL